MKRKVLDVVQVLGAIALIYATMQLAPDNPEIGLAFIGGLIKGVGKVAGGILGKAAPVIGALNPYIGAGLGVIQALSSSGAQGEANKYIEEAIARQRELDEQYRKPLRDITLRELQGADPTAQVSAADIFSGPSSNPFTRKKGLTTYQIGARPPENQIGARPLARHPALVAARSATANRKPNPWTVGKEALGRLRDDDRYTEKLRRFIGRFAGRQ